jgi:hypothetical protein
MINSLHSNIFIAENVSHFLQNTIPELFPAFSRTGYESASSLLIASISESFCAVCLFLVIHESHSISGFEWQT